MEVIGRAYFNIPPNLRLRFLVGVLIHKLFRPKTVFFTPSGKKHWRNVAIGLYTKFTGNSLVTNIIQDKIEIGCTI